MCPVGNVLLRTNRHVLSFFPHYCIPDRDMPFSEGHFHFWMQIHLVRLSGRAQPGRPRQRPATVRGRSVPGSRVCAHTQAAHRGTRWRTRRWRRGAGRRAATARPAARRRSGHRAPAAAGCWARFCRALLPDAAGAGRAAPGSSAAVRTRCICIQKWK